MKKWYSIPVALAAFCLPLFMASGSLADPRPDGSQVERPERGAPSFPFENIEGFSELSAEDQAYIRTEVEKLKGLPREEFMEKLKALLAEKGLKLPAPPEPPARGNN